MSFRAKIWASMVVAGVVPLLLLGVLSYSTGRRELGGTLGRLQAQRAQDLARQAERLVADAVGNLQLAVSYIPFEDLKGEERSAALAIPYRQLPYVNALALLDARGQALSPPVYEANPGARPEFASHEAVSEADLDLFATRIPLAAALQSGAAVGPPYRSPGRAPRVAVAVKVPRVEGWVLAAELTLAELQGRLDEIARQGEAAYLVDSTGALLTAEGVLEESEKALVGKGLASPSEQVDTLTRGGATWLAAFAPVRRLGWGVVVAQPTSVAFRTLERVRDLTVLWAALAVAATLGLGVLLSRGLSRPIRALSEVARAATTGTYGPARGVEGQDEIGEFARAFNHMIEEIQRRDVEIRKWNEELQQRVDQRTAELKQAQDQILRARRLAALGSLGAGVAHEINNPLTSIIGLLTLLQRDAAPESAAGKSATTALEQARRVAKIVANLRQLSTSEHENAGKRFALSGPVTAALDSCSELARGARVAVSTDFAADVPEVLGDPPQIQQLVLHLVQNALAAMPDGGDLRVTLARVEDAARLTVADTGRGIPAHLLERIFDPFFSNAGQDTPARQGMGLSLCHAIAEGHHGRLSVESAPGRGTTFTLLLPAAPKQAHIY